MKDLISRQEAIDELNIGAELLRRVLDDADVVGAERAKYEWGLGLIESYISDMKELPPAQPEQAMGEWIDTDNYYQRWKCSVCGCHTRDAKPPYCSNCGKKMKEE